MMKNTNKSAVKSNLKRGKAIRNKNTVKPNEKKSITKKPFGGRKKKAVSRIEPDNIDN